MYSFKFLIISITACLINGFLDDELTLEERLAAVEQQLKQCQCTARPAFMAGLSTSIENCTKGQHVIFDSVTLNVGNGYNKNHGLFTAPVAGVYEFSFSLAIGHGYFQVELVKNNLSNPIGYLFESTTSWEKRSTNVLTHMNAGDEVWLACISNTRIDGSLNHVWGGAGDYHSHMSGFLISAD